MTQRCILYIVFITIVFYSCQFEPFQEPFTHDLAPRNQESGIQLNEHSPGDTIVLNKPKDFYLSFSDRFNEIYRLNCYLGSRRIRSEEANEIFFNLNPLHYPPGIYELRFEATINPESGSLANKLGRENLSDQWVYYLSISHDYPYPIVITSVNQQDGYLRVNWEQYKYDNLDYLQILATYYSDTLLTNEKSTWRRYYSPDKDFVYLDSNYVGGPVSFSVRVKALDSLVQGPEYFHMDPGINFYSTDNMFTLAWNKCNYNSNFNKYILYRDRSVLKEFKSVNDTTFIIPKDELALAKEETYYVRMAGFDDSKLYYPKTGNYTIFRGRKDTRFSYLDYNNTHEFYYARTSDSLFIIDNDFKARPDKLFIFGKNIVLSGDGNLLYTIKFKTLEQRDPVTLELLKVIDLTPFLPVNDGNYYAYPYNLNLSEANILSFNASYHYSFKFANADPVWFRSTVAFAIDLNLEQEIFHEGGSRPVISPNGELMCFGKKIYRYEEGQWNEQFQILNDENIMRDFKWKNDDKFYLYFQAKVYGDHVIGIGNLTAQGLTESQAVSPDFIYYTFDNKESILIRSSNQLRVYNFSDLNSYLEYYRNTSQSNWNLLNDYIFSSPYIINIHE